MRSVLFVTNCLAIGGAEVQVVRMAEGLRDRGWRVGVASLLPIGAQAPLAAELRGMGIDVFTLGMRPGVPDPRGILRLRRLIRSFKPCVVHSHVLHANLLARLTRLVSHFCVLICTAHSIREGTRLHEIGYRVTDPLADLTTHVSQAAVEHYVRIGAAPASRIRFVANGLDLSRFARNETARQRLRAELRLGDRFAWLAVGRMETPKDYPNMLRAFALCKGECICACAAAAAMPTAPGLDSPSRAAPILVLAGGGTLRRDLHGLALKLGLEADVRFLGPRSDVAELMSAADAMVLSSAWEGMPLVLQEAGAAELPMVATDVGGVREVVGDGQSGILLPPRDAQALAAAMQRIMAMPAERRRAMGAAGRRIVEDRFAMDRVLDEWEDIYLELMLRNTKRCRWPLPCAAQQFAGGSIN